MTSPLTERHEPLSSTALRDSTKLVEVLPGSSATVATLKSLLPDVKTLLFFAKALDLDFDKLGELLTTVFPGSTVINALFNEADQHSSDLQDYLAEILPEDLVEQYGDPKLVDDPEPVDSEVLTELFKQSTVEIADSIKKVAKQIGQVLEALPSKYGRMTFGHLHELNTQRNTIGTFKARIVHDPVPPALVIFDVSGSMTESTVREIVDEVVALAYDVDASLAIVSSSTFFWEAGTFSSQTVLNHAEFGMTHYHTLLPLFQGRDWGTVITIADYDSQGNVPALFRQHATSRVGTVYDVSLVNRVTHLATCVGQIAAEVKPLMIGNSSSVLR